MPHHSRCSEVALHLVNICSKESPHYTRMIATTTDGKTEVDLKRYCKIEKIIGGRIEDAQLVKGVVFSKVSPASRLRISVVVKALWSYVWL